MPEVKEVLHVPDITWTQCNSDLFRKWPSEDFFGNVIPLYSDIVELNPELKILIFSGDTDLICPTVGTQRWVFNLSLPVYITYNIIYI
jgi:hypothetical protein